MRSGGRWLLERVWVETVRSSGLLPISWLPSLSEKTRNPITVKLWNKRGLPVMLATLISTTILFVIAYSYLSK